MAVRIYCKYVFIALPPFQASPVQNIHVTETVITAGGFSSPKEEQTTARETPDEISTQTHYRTYQTQLDGIGTHAHTHILAGPQHTYMLKDQPHTDTHTDKTGKILSTA